MKRFKVTSRLMPNPPNGKRVVRPSRFSNPYKVEDYGREQSLELFRKHLEDNPALVEMARKELAGYDLGCTCNLGQACHADIWIELLS